MDAEQHRAGLAVSGAMHLALFAVLVFGFARAPKFDDAPESIPVETISTAQLNEIMEGEKEAKPAPEPRKAVEAPAPQPPVRPAPPPPPQPEPPPPPEPPKPPPPEPPPPEPPQRPPPPKPEPPKPEPPKPEPPKPQAEEAPSPPTRPRPEKPVETPRPPERPRPTQEAKPDKPKPDKPKPDKFKPDEIAKALAHEKPDEKPRPRAPSYDPNAIAKMLGPTRTAEATQPSSAASQGLANHHAQRMSVSLENALNEWFRDSYKNCWSLPPNNPNGENYVFDVRVTFNPDGSLSGRPQMLNPPHDPQWQAHADSVMRAVARCNPLRVPTQYAPFFDQWRTKVVHFDPSSAEG